MIKRFLTSARFLPATIFVAALTLSFKIGNIFEGLDKAWDGGLVIAGAEAQQPGAGGGLPLETPSAAASANGAGNGVADAQPADVPPAAAEAEPAPPARMAIEDPTLLTQAEIDLLQQLAERRAEIVAREDELRLREGMLKAAETRIDKKIEDLKGLEITVEKLVATYDEQEAARVASLVKIYENMKPKDAARIFEQLDMDTLLMVAERMKERSLAPVMAEMDPGKARDVTVDLARRRELPMTNRAAGS